MGRYGDIFPIEIEYNNHTYKFTGILKHIHHMLVPIYTANSENLYRALAFDFAVSVEYAEGSRKESFISIGGEIEKTYIKTEDGYDTKS